MAPTFTPISLDDYIVKSSISLQILQTIALINDLGSPDWQTRTAARHHLESLGDSAIPAILNGCRHQSPQVRADSVSLLDHLADERCLDALRTALGDPSARVRRHAIHSLGCQMCKRQPLQLDIVGLIIPLALRDPSIRVRRVAVHQLGLQAPDPRISAALDTILNSESDPGLVSRARHACSRHHPAAGSAC
jgi:HEAT repeat protein